MPLDPGPGPGSPDRTVILCLKCQLSALHFELALIKYVLVLRLASYNPDQPRVPAGTPDGGQWTSELDDGPGVVQVAENEPDPRDPNRVISDVPSGTVRVAQEAGPSDAEGDGNLPSRGIEPIWRVNPRRLGVEIDTDDPEWAYTALDAEAAVARVRHLEPDWQPEDYAYGDIAGAIAANRAVTSEAQARLVYQQAFRFGDNGPPEDEDPASEFIHPVNRPPPSTDAFRLLNDMPPLNGLARPSRKVRVRWPGPRWTANTCLA